VACYLVDLAEYDFILVHKPGKVNHMDHLSWHPGYNTGMHDNEDVLVLPDHLFINAMQLGRLEANVVKQQKGRPEIEDWKTTWPVIEKDGVLLHHGHVVVPEV
jgi:hypothetical protein